MLLALQLLVPITLRCPRQPAVARAFIVSDVPARNQMAPAAVVHPIPPSAQFILCSHLLQQQKCQPGSATRCSYSLLPRRPAPGR